MLLLQLHIKELEALASPELREDGMTTPPFPLLPRPPSLIFFLCTWPFALGRALFPGPASPFRPEGGPRVRLSLRPHCFFGGKG